MKAQPNEPGRVVISTQGHDEGRWYVILSVLNERDLLLCDGDIRKLSKPKKKQVKHVRALPLTVPLDGRGESGGPVADSDIRKALRSHRKLYETQTGYQPGNGNSEKEEFALVQE